MPDFMPARLTVDLFKAARGVPTTTKVGLIRDGRRVRNSECEIMQDGATVARATMVQYRRAEAPRGEQWVSATDFDWPAEFGAAGLSYMGSDGVGWTSGIGEHQNTARKRFINRMIDVVEGHDNTPFVRATMVAEGTSLVTNLGTGGVGYINGDLTVALARLPVDEWMGVQADSHRADGRDLGRHGDPVRPHRRLRLRSGDRGRQPGGADRLHQRPVPVAHSLSPGHRPDAPFRTTTCFALAWSAAACACSLAASSFAAAIAALPSGLAFELPDDFADATPALQFRSNSTVSVTGAKSSPLIQGAFSECVTMQSSSASESPVRVAITPFMGGA